MKGKQGFTLIELMIVVAIIAIIAAIAIPSLLNARKAGNEASAISSLRTLTTVNEQYRTRFGEYSDGLSSLSTTNYIDSVLGAGTKSGYTFTYTRTNSNQWDVVSDPESSGVTGDRGFYVDQSGVIRATAGSGADSTSSPID